MSCAQPDQDVCWLSRDDGQSEAVRAGRELNPPVGRPYLAGRVDFTRPDRAVSVSTEEEGRPMDSALQPDRRDRLEEPAVTDRSSSTLRTTVQSWALERHLRVAEIGEIPRILVLLGLSDWDSSCDSASVGWHLYRDDTAHGRDHPGGGVLWSAGSGAHLRAPRDTASCGDIR